MKNKINKKIKKITNKCDCCGYEGEAKKFYITDNFPILDKKIGYCICENCMNVIEKFNRMVEIKLKEADQA